MCVITEYTYRYRNYTTYLKFGTDAAYANVTDLFDPSTTRIFLRGNCRLEARPSIEDRSSPAGRGVNLSKRGAM